MGRLKLLLVISLFAPSSACWSYVNRALDFGAHPPASSEFQVWSRDSGYIIKALRVEYDTLTGVRAETGAAPGSTIALPMALVDSVRSLETNVGRTFGLTLGLITIGIFLFRSWALSEGT